MENKSLKVGILGLGLIGGSILKALYKKVFLIGVSNSSYKKAAKYADITGNDINLLTDCNVVFVCSKMSETKNKLKELEKILAPDTIVADVCSIKKFLTRDYKFNYIPTHPMAGTEFFGFENSDENLFIGAKWIMAKKNEILSSLIKKTGAIPLILNPNKHDKFAAEISHLPMLISVALFNSTDDNAKKIASSGFRDTTRLALTNPDLAYDMLNLNRENIKSACEKFKKNLDEILELNELEFKKLSVKVANERSKMYDEDGKNIL